RRAQAQRARRAGRAAAREPAAADGARNPKKSDGLLRQGEPVRFWLIATEKACYPVALLCRVLKVSRSGYYAWHQRPAATRTVQDQSLALEVAAIHAQSRGPWSSISAAAAASRRSSGRGPHPRSSASSRMPTCARRLMSAARPTPVRASSGSSKGSRPRLAFPTDTPI